MPTAIITGASKGLGRALAAQLADEGWNLIIDARGAAALHSTADALRVGGSAACRSEPVGRGERVRIEPIVGDITSAEHRDALIRAAAATGRLDLLVNNAGTLGPSPLPSGAELDPAALRDIVETNVIAPHALTQAALPLLRASNGVVVDVTSDAAVEAYPGWGGYGAAKAATEQLRNVLGAEETDVTVWRVDPGDLRTDMHQLAFPGEDISDRPLPETVAPGLLGLLAARPTSGRYRLSDYVAHVGSSTDDAAVADGPATGELGTPLGTHEGDAERDAERAGAGSEAAIAVVALVGGGASVASAGSAGVASAGSAGVASAGSAGVANAGSARESVAGDGPIALWLTIEVEDFATAATFYREVVGLPEIDGWSADGEVGSVFAVGPAARVEIERPAKPSPGARLAIEYPDFAALTAAHERITAHAGSGATPLVRHGRGHSGFTIYDPRGTELYLWSEK